LNKKSIDEFKKHIRDCISFGVSMGVKREDITLTNVNWDDLSEALAIDELIREGFLEEKSDNNTLIPTETYFNELISILVDSA